ncbi:MAG: hypothetical protein ACFFCQ_08290 [Promethearchaeota archaeon]
MSFPCPHCGCKHSFGDRSQKDIKPIIPTTLQESFDEPPPLIQQTPSQKHSAVRPVAPFVSSVKTSKKQAAEKPGVPPISPEITPKDERPSVIAEVAKKLEDIPLGLATKPINGVGINSASDMRFKQIESRLTMLENRMEKVIQVFRELNRA